VARLTRQAVDEAADALRRILTAIEDGELEAANSQDVVLVRRLQGAVAALEELSGKGKRGPEHSG
jgi:hypothetical protein